MKKVYGNDQAEEGGSKQFPKQFLAIPLNNSPANPQAINHTNKEKPMTIFYRIETHSDLNGNPFNTFVPCYTLPNLSP